MAKRRNDAGWRQQVFDRRGAVCRSCGDVHDVQCDHLKPRGQGGRSDVENGLPLCGPWSRVTPGGCHLRKTEKRMLVRHEWLDDDQIEYLAEIGWVAWDDDGQPFGNGMRGFAPLDRKEPVNG